MLDGVVTMVALTAIRRGATVLLGDAVSRAGERCSRE
jgi:hypothetical protein